MIEVLDHGFVELVDFMGSDYRILQAARVSTGGTGKTTDEKDKLLIDYLYRNRHSSPFEKVIFEFHVKCPIFVVRQWFRHRTWSYNEYSARYSPMIDDYYHPEHFRKQGKTNHQGSGKDFDGILNMELQARYASSHNKSKSTYEFLLEQGVAKEMARMVMPTSTYTEFYGTIDLWNLFHFLTLRTHEHAQFEIREFANAVFTLIKRMPEIKWSMAAFEENLKIETVVQKLKNAFIDDSYEPENDEETGSLLLDKLYNILNGNDE